MIHEQLPSGNLIPAECFLPSETCLPNERNHAEQFCRSVWRQRQLMMKCLCTCLATLLLVSYVHGSETLAIEKAQWIAREKENAEKASETSQNGPLPIFRKSFKLDEAAISDARVAICGLGHFELSINGQKVGDHFIDPPWSDYAETCYYVNFDVTKYLKPGENVLGVMLGNGMYNVKGGRYTKFIGSFGPPKLTISLKVSRGDKTTVVESDGSWKVDDGPILFSCAYGGEDYDARREQPGWDKPGFDDHLWKPVQVVQGPGGTLRPAISPPVKVVRHLKAVSVKKLEDGRYEVDLGENLSSRPTIKVKGNAGSQATIETAERQGQPWAGHSYTYTLKGDAQPEEFAPWFTYFGFRYLYVSGVAWGDDANVQNDLPTLIDVGADFVSSCGLRIGTFDCSNPLLNEIDAMIDRSVTSNLQHVLTDCPHREKLGWLEVAHLMGPSIFYHYDMGSLYRKICQDMTDSQLENGLVPDTAPEYARFEGGFFESPEWGSASVQIPWLLYQWYGDEDILRQQYDTMAGYVDYLASTRNEAGLAKAGLGDWYDWAPEHGHVGQSQLTPWELTATCMLYSNARILQQVTKLQHKDADVQKWGKLANEVRRDFLKAYYDSDKKTVSTGSQCALALGLYFHLVPDQDREAVLANLVRNIEQNQYRPSAGEVSFRYLVLALAEAGRSDVVYRMVNRTDAPGYGCMIKQYGLRTLSERWDRPGESLNHCMFGHIQEWLQGYLLGIRQAPGSIGHKKILVDPYISADLQWAKGTFDSPSGRVEVGWVKKDGYVEVTINAENVEIIIPENRKDLRWKLPENCSVKKLDLTKKHDAVKDAAASPASGQAKSWTFSSEELQPFWQSTTMHGESLLFFDEGDGSRPKTQLLFQPTRIISVCNASGDVQYEQGRDYIWEPGQKEIVLPQGSRIIFKKPEDMRRPAGSQSIHLIPRDGNGEIFFGATHEYHDMQTVVTYEHKTDVWHGPKPSFTGKQLPLTIQTLSEKRPLTIALLGDSISTGCNSSGWAKTAPFQPAYFDLLTTNLESAYRSKVTLKNFSRGGMATPWGLANIDKVIEAKPDLVLLAFGMNDAGGLAVDKYKANTQAMIEAIHQNLPNTEIILVATMLANREWVALDHDRFPKFRDALAELCGPGVALADMTSVWDELLKHKKNWDLTGNGVNHPNDFGHRVYAQVLSSLLIPESKN